MSKNTKQTVIQMIAAPSMADIFKNSTPHQVKVALEKFGSKHTGFVRYSVSSDDPSNLVATLERPETERERHTRLMAEAKVKLEAKRAELKARDAAKKAEKEKKAATSLEKEYYLYLDLKKKFENNPPSLITTAKVKSDAKKVKAKTQKKKSVSAGEPESNVSSKA